MPLLALEEVLILFDTYFRIRGIENQVLRKFYIEELSTQYEKLSLFQS